MYRISDFEFIQYQNAEDKLNKIRRDHALEIQELYDGIHPSRTAFDYGIGKIYSESIRVEDYAIYIADLKTDHKRYENWWEVRLKAYKEAVNRLTNEEQVYLISWDYEVKVKVLRKLRDVLSEIITKSPHLQRQTVATDYFDDIEECDEQVEKMNKKELLEDYQDYIGEESSEEPPQHENVNSSTQKKKTAIFGVATYYLSPEELEAYRSGKKGGTKWYSYDDYLQMKKAGKKYSEIAKEMGIDPSILSRRIRAWKGKQRHMECK